ncbi:NAD-dependent epimerase/dehydratase family protein [Methylomonas paludis]|uniref:NAD-dependent epimerase/dehydratase family protein n=1 Tax=Methylomonas paludis TaxID=1173101 RepID=A0A975MNK2_9GAMM|nr:NAD-dependent epimerase/dehydratase family protein [Methylomonas paludis]QWF70934.1 NAD-dependent epimerase/dehydratase family protein [Methylomonas paludis]
MLARDTKILVTGANGFIGKHLSNYLAQQGYSVRTSSRQPLDLPDHWSLNLATDPCPDQLCAGIDTIFHLAGKAHALTENSQDAAEYLQINTEGTRKLLVAAQQADVKRFIFFSSVKAVGEAVIQPMDESLHIAADTPYGTSKYLAEQLVLHGDYVPHPVVIRPCMVYGNTHKGNLPKMIKAIQRGLFPPLPEFHNKRSMVHVEDLIRAALLTATLAQAAGQIYIVSDDEPYSTRQLYNLIRSVLGKSTLSWSLPPALFSHLAKLGDTLGQISGKRMMFDSDALQKLTGSAHYSSAKIKAELGFQPRHNLPESLADIIRFLYLI